MITINLYRVLSGLMIALGAFIIGIFVGVEILVFAEEHQYVPVILSGPTVVYYIIGALLLIGAILLHRFDPQQKTQAS
jgi:hypothetical protein